MERLFTVPRSDLRMEFLACARCYGGCPLTHDHDFKE